MCIFALAQFFVYKKHTEYTLTDMPPIVIRVVLDHSVTPEVELLRAHHDIDAEQFMRAIGKIKLHATRLNTCPLFPASIVMALL